MNQGVGDRAPWGAQHKFRAVPSKSLLSLFTQFSPP